MANTRNNAWFQAAATRVSNPEAPVLTRGAARLALTVLPARFEPLLDHMPAAAEGAGSRPSAGVGSGGSACLAA